MSYIFKRWVGVKDEKFYYQGSLKNQIFTGVTKTNSGELPKEGFGQFADLRGGLGKKEEGGVFEVFFYDDLPIINQ